ncbi:purine nucleoside phosphorylase [Aquipluma nitroreducens]|uniref:Uridine phosphorylase n=1 Tax=Aquipluma nitroreducens TaxID=2010828 RepID=A0A5K7S4X7_9BACT|nr:nucleoside phosphorylase [Aquipluma nitroreducens]BBE16557.1 purine nucleoside phosphorylase [Aquipluma nitroreducens]
MIKSSELIINADGSIFHLHLKPEQIADNIILVGDPGRVELIGKLLTEIEFQVQNREFVSTTGKYNNQRVTIVSTGIGTDNIDIVVNELDALANINLVTREINPVHRKLNFIRIGTSGGLQDYLGVNSFVISQKAIGFDGLLNFYANRNSVSDLAFEEAFRKHTEWGKQLTSPYVVNCSELLLKKMHRDDTIAGVTISAPGFYGPQGRVLRLPLADPDLNEKIESFVFEGHKITNFEMECSAIYGLSKLLGHEALTICLIIANRLKKEANSDYHQSMETLIKLVLDRLTS